MALLLNVASMCITCFAAKIGSSSIETGASIHRVGTLNNNNDSTLKPWAKIGTYLFIYNVPILAVKDTWANRRCGM